MSGLVALCEVLKTNSSLCKLKCVFLAPCHAHVHVLAFQTSAVSTL